MKIIALILSLFASIHAHAVRLEHIDTNDIGWQYSMSIPVDADTRGAAAIVQMISPDGTYLRNLHALTAAQCREGYGYTRMTDLNGANPKRGFTFMLGGPTIGDAIAARLCAGWTAAVRGS